MRTFTKLAGLRKDGVTALNLGRLDFVGLVKGHKRQMNRQPNHLKNQGSSKDVCLMMTLTKDHQVNVCRSHLVPID